MENIVGEHILEHFLWTDLSHVSAPLWTDLLPLQKARNIFTNGGGGCLLELKIKSDKSSAPANVISSLGPTERKRRSLWSLNIDESFLSICRTVLILICIFYVKIMLWKYLYSVNGRGKRYALPPRPPCHLVRHVMERDRWVSFCLWIRIGLYS